MNRRKFLKLIPTSAGTAIIVTKVDAASIIPNPKPWCEEDDVNDFIMEANEIMRVNGRLRGHNHNADKSRLPIAIKLNQVIE